MSLCSFVFSALHGMLTWTTMHRGLAMRNVSVRLSVCLSVKRVIVTKRKKNLSTFSDTCLMNRKSISKQKFDKKYLNPWPRRTTSGLGKRTAAILDFYSRFLF